MRETELLCREVEGLEIEFEPDLTDCIQTLAKREYDRALRELLGKSAGDEYLQQKLETLKLFLESADFPRLRSKYEKYLLEGKKVTFKMQNFNRQLEYSMEVH
ncbi:MAG: hypothetical protein PHV74_08310 [Dehalococcoidia bacterium]|nr:hypothetical protein [Dehalococcoidia bacterium]